MLRLVRTPKWLYGVLIYGWRQVLVYADVRV